MKITATVRSYRKSIALWRSLFLPRLPFGGGYSFAKKVGAYLWVVSESIV
jgi:hypothetical protein